MKTNYKIGDKGSVSVEDVFFKVAEGEKSAYIVSVFVGGGHRKKGLGRELMDMVMADADRENVVLYLTIYPSGKMSNVALRKWYKRLGFDRWKRVSDPDPNYIDRPTAYRREPR